MIERTNEEIRAMIDNTDNIVRHDWVQTADQVCHRPGHRDLADTLLMLQGQGHVEFHWSLESPGFINRNMFPIAVSSRRMPSKV